MSNQEDKDKRSRRLSNEKNIINKQLKIAKNYNLDVDQYEGHRYAKHHVLNCGNPKCVMCGNPRKVWKEKTKQEESFEQTNKWIEE